MGVPKREQYTLSRGQDGWWIVQNDQCPLHPDQSTRLITSIVIGAVDLVSVISACLWWEAKCRQGNLSEAQGPASLAIIAVSKRPCLTQGEKREPTPEVALWPPHACDAKFACIHTHEPSPPPKYGAKVICLQGNHTLNFESCSFSAGLVWSSLVMAGSSQSATWLQREVTDTAAGQC